MGSPSWCGAPPMPPSGGPRTRAISSSERRSRRPRSSAPLLLGIFGTLPGIPALTAGSGEASRVHWTQIFGLLFAALVPLGALILMLATGLESTASFVVVAAATVSVIVLALARMWRLVDQVRVLTEQRGHDRLAAMVEHSSDVVMLADQTGRVSYASPGLRATLGYNPESWVGRHLLDVVAEDERESAIRQFERLVEFGNGGTVEFEATLIARRRPAPQGDRRRRQPRRWRRRRRHRRHVPRRHRAAQPRAPAQPSRLPRRADRARQPGAVPRSHGPRPARRPPRGRPGGGAVRRPRRLQVGQRRARPRRRRPAAEDRRRSHPPRGRHRRHRRPPRRRRVRDPARGPRRHRSRDRRRRAAARQPPRPGVDRRLRRRRARQRRRRRRLAGHEHDQPAARRRHRDVRGQARRQGPDPDLRPGDAAGGHASTSSTAATSARRSSAARCGSSTCRSSTSARARSSAPRRSCAGITRSTATSRPASSCRSPNGPG